MEELALHSLGKDDYIKSLKEKYLLLKRNIKNSDDLKDLNKSFKKAKKDSSKNLY